MSDNRFCVYILRCGDGSLYCGIATDLDRRVREHREGKGARYTAARRPVELVFATSNRFDRAEAQSLERKVKKLRRVQKRVFLERLEGNERREDFAKNGKKGGVGGEKFREALLS